MNQKKVRAAVLIEHTEQTALFSRLALYEGKYPELRWIFAIPNGGHRHIAVAAKMKAEGVMNVFTRVIWSEGENTPNCVRLIIEDGKAVAITIFTTLDVSEIRINDEHLKHLKTLITEYEERKNNANKN